MRDQRFPLYVCAENKRVHQELRRAAADVARLQKKVRKGARTWWLVWSSSRRFFTLLGYVVVWKNLKT